jgi:hypothetical protein
MLDLKCCPGCAKFTDAENKTCPYCGRVFEKSRTDQDFSFQPPVPSPAQTLPAPVKTIRSSPAEVPPPQAGKIRNPWIAAVLSVFFIGWGQWYNGRTWDGIRYVLYAIAAAFIFIVLALLLLKTGLVMLILVPYFIVIAIIWGTGIIDAFNTAEKINRGDLVFTKKSALFWVPALILVFNILIIAMVGVSALAALQDSPARVDVYNNPSLGLHLQYPGSWKYTEKTAPGNPNVTSIQFARNDGGLMALVQVADAAGTATPPRTLDEWAADLEMSLPNVSSRTDYHLVSSGMSNLSGNPARRIEYTALTNEGKRMRGLVYLMITGTKGVMVAIVSNDDSEGVLSEGPRQFVSSITLKQ